MHPRRARTDVEEVYRSASRGQYIYDVNIVPQSNYSAVCPMPREKNDPNYHLGKTIDFTG
jgi:hypothetical protein